MTSPSLIQSFLSPSQPQYPPSPSPSPSSPSPPLHLSLSKLPFSLSNPKHNLIHPLSTNSTPQFAPIPKSHLSPNHSSTDELFNFLRLSVRYGDVELAKAVHGSIVKLEDNTRLGNALIAAYIKLDLVTDAYKVFLRLSCPNVVSYTALISGFAKSNREDKAMELFAQMRSSGIEPNEYSFVAIITACIRVMKLELSFQIHALVIKMGYADYIFVANALLGFYKKCGCVDTVLVLFDEMPERDIVSWNTVISCFVKELNYDKAFELFYDMQRIDGFKMDQFSLSTMLAASAGSLASMEGKKIHGHSLKIGFESNLSVNNALISFYTKCGKVENVKALIKKMPVKDVITWTEMIVAYMEFGFIDLAMEIFEKMPERNCLSYNAILSGFCRNAEGSRALDFFLKMMEDGVEMNDSMLTSVVNACGLIMEAQVSEQIHAYIIKSVYGSNTFIEAALIDMCTRCGRMTDAHKIFSQQPFELGNSVTWTSMLCGYARDGQPEAALSLFHMKLIEGTIIVDKVESTAVLGVCGALGFHEMGKQIHCHTHKSDFVTGLGVGNALISMYSKCGDMKDAINVFNTMPSRDIVSWNSLITGHLFRRHGDKALSVWSKMEKKGIKPDKITLFLIISAYKYTSLNLVDNCRSFFVSMNTIYKIEPNLEHYASFIGVLGKWGFIEEAEEIINKMPVEPNASVWRALLDSCRIHKNTIIGKRATKHILEMDPQDPSAYILKSNLYSAMGRWHCSEMVRKQMAENGFKKHPSRSWIIRKNNVHTFYARDKSHSENKNIYSGVEILIKECMKVGYVPDTSFVLHEVDEHQKKDFLFYHSAKLAVTYGLLTSKPAKPIRVMKNIAMCGDCHTFFKYISVVTRREILLRDGSGFHCFRNGRCSCNDYW